MRTKSTEISARLARHVRLARPVSSPAIAIAVGCALLSGGSCGVSLLDYGAHVDGPGIGLEWSKPLGSEYGFALTVVLVSIVVNALVSLVAWGRSGAKPVGQAALCGLWFVGLVAGFAGGARALPLWWKLGCHRGHAFACHAAAGVTDGAESEALEARACANGVERACPRVPEHP
jgi:hypothetical protein